MSEKLEIEIVGGGGGGGSPPPAGGGASGPPSGGGGGGGAAGEAMNIAEAVAGGGAAGGLMAGLQAGAKLAAQGWSAAGEVIGRIASMSPDAAVDGISKLGKTIPIAGAAFGAIIDAGHALANTLDALSRRYAAVNAELSVAVAMSDLNQTMGDMRRAEKLAPDLSEFMASKSNASQAIQDAMASLLKVLMPPINAGMKVVENLAESTAAIALAVEKIDQLDLSMNGLRTIGDQIKALLAKEKENQKNIIDQVHKAMTVGRGNGGVMRGAAGLGPNDPARMAVQGLGPVAMRPFGGF